MTGKELIIYILKNNLEDEPVIKDGVLIGFMTRVEAAKKFGVGTATIQVWIEHGLLESFMLNGATMIPKNSQRPADLKEVLYAKDSKNDICSCSICNSINA